MSWDNLLFWKQREPELDLSPLAPPADQVKLGAAAQTLISDPVFRLALDRVERRLIDTWRMSAVGDTRQREAAYYLHSAMQELRAELQRMITDGRNRRQAV